MLAERRDLPLPRREGGLRHARAVDGSFIHLSLDRPTYLSTSDEVCQQNFVCIIFEIDKYKLFNFLNDSGFDSFLYLEQPELNKNGFVVARTKSAIENGKSEGVVVLGQAIKTGDYFLRGYTRYQRNIDQEKINFSMCGSYNRIKFQF